MTAQKKYATAQTALDKILDEAVAVRRKLRRLEENRKLTFPAFLAEALELADSTHQEIKDLDEKIKTHPGTHEAQAFLRRLVAALRESTYPRCPSDPGKILNCYGSDGAAIELSNLGATISQAVAVAVMVVHRRWGDDAFGVIENWQKFETDTENLQSRLDHLADKMRAVVCGDDLDFDTSKASLLPSEIARGLCRVSFRRAPAISHSGEDWPRLLIEDAERAVPALIPKAPKKKRIRLEVKRKAA